MGYVCHMLRFSFLNGKVYLLKSNSWVNIYGYKVICAISANISASKFIGPAGMKVFNNMESRGSLLICIT